MLFNKKSIFALLAAGLAVATAAQPEVADCVANCLVKLPDVTKCLNDQTPACLCSVIKPNRSTFYECIKTTCDPTVASENIQTFDIACPGTDKPTSTPTKRTSTAVTEVTKATSTAITEDTKPTTVVTEDVEPTNVTEEPKPTGNSTISVTGHANTTMVTSTKATTATPTIEISTGGVEGTFTGMHSGLFAALAAAAAMFAL